MAGRAWWPGRACWAAERLFRGGNTASWAGARDGFVDIDKVKITQK